MIVREVEGDTIVAVATACGEGGIGIVRLSGTQAIVIAENIFRSRGGRPVANQKSFTAQYGQVVAPGQKEESLEVVDEALLLLMRAPKSYTGEDVVELQVHGSPVVLQKILDLAVQRGARLAAPGEFTKRAFLNGRIDLMQAEAVIDLVQAKTQKSQQWASAQLEGQLSKKFLKYKQALIEVLSVLEASIDFPDDDLGLEDVSRIQNQLAGIRQEVAILLSGSDLGILAKKGVGVALWGRPNSGKSSLMNQLAKKNRVIVTPLPGTTRDVVEEEIQLAGYWIRLSDTAGIQATENVVEIEGISRSRQAVLGADLILFVLDQSMSLGPEDEALYQEIVSKPKIIVLNKKDLPSKIKKEDLKRKGWMDPMVETSCFSGEGIDKLEEQILLWMTQGKLEAQDQPLLTSVRQKTQAEKIAVSLDQALLGVRQGLSPELIVVDVREALDHLGMLVGDVVTDDLLDELFSRFCIGK